ncbi:MAG: hypothetical protein R3B09_14620 [Nannocystaceae bacterium]
MSDVRPLETLASAPRLARQRGFVDAATRARILALAEPARLAALGVAVHDDRTGLSCELPVACDPALVELRDRVEALTGIPNAIGDTLRLRRVRVGDGHPPHSDAHGIAGYTLLVTVMITLVAPEAGGATVFPDAEGGPIAVTPEAGAALIWSGFRRDGPQDPSARHAGEVVTAGEKVTLTAFIYQTRDWATGLLPAERPPPSGRRLVIVDDGVPAATVRLLRRAAIDRGVAVDVVDARRFDYSSAAPLAPGTLLYRPAVSRAAALCEQFLWAPGVVSFHREPWLVWATWQNPTLLLQRAGLPVPPTIWITTRDRSLLRRAVAHLGGFPLVLRGMGAEGGVGVVRVDSWPALFSLVDLVHSRGDRPELCAFIADSIHWRLVVVGSRVVAAYPNPTIADDFRSFPAEDPAVYGAAPSAALEALAVRATLAHALDFGGVDLLVAADGRAWVLEVNFPCYFPHAQEVAGIDIAGAMVDHLVRRADAVE